MFGIGWVEVVIVGLIVFLLMKPEDLPRVMRTAGRYAGQIKKYMNAINGEFTSIAREIEKMEDEDSNEDRDEENKS